MLAPTSGVARTLGLLTEVITAATIADDAQHDFKQVRKLHIAMREKDAFIVKCNVIKFVAYR